MLPPALYPQVEAILFNLLDDEDQAGAGDHAPTERRAHHRVAFQAACREPGTSPYL